MSFLARVAILLFPIVVFLAGVLILRGSRSKTQTSRTEKKPPWWKRLPLNQRLYGYGVKAVRDYWGALKEQGKLGEEEKALRKDLFFPPFYGGALLLSSILAWSRWLAAPPGAPDWLVFGFPLAAILSDWTENLIQLRELALFQREGRLEHGLIHVASAATSLKLISIVGSLWMIWRLLFGF